MDSKVQAHTLAQVRICLVMDLVINGGGRSLTISRFYQGHELRIEVKPDKVLLLKVRPISISICYNVAFHERHPTHVHV